MPEFVQRTEHERDVAAAIAGEFASQRRRWQQGAAVLLLLDDGHRQRLAVALLVPLADAHAAAAQSMGRAEGWELPADRIAEESRRWAEAMAAALADEIVGASRDLADQGWDGETIFSEERAVKISVTEITRAISAAEALAALLAAEVLEVDRLAPIWHTELDGRVCSICRPLNGTSRTVWGDAFPGGPPAHPYCRCWLDWRRE